MQARIAWFLVAVLCLPAAALAQSINSVTPQSFFVFAVEEFIKISGTELTGTESTVVEFSGPAGSFMVEPNLNPSWLDVWVPDIVFSAAGTYTVKVFATDVNQPARQTDQGTFDVIERLVNAPPLIGLPEVVIAEATSREGAIVSFDAGGLGSGGASLPASCNPSSGTLFPLGTTTVHCTVTDPFGSAEGDMLVVVTDTTPPVVTVPADIISATQVVTFTATATDNIDGNLPVDCNPASGSTFAIGMTIVVCQATDARANTGAASFAVIAGDTMPPTVTNMVASPPNLWPPNHKMVAVTVTVTVQDDADPAPVSRIVAVTSNQPINGPGDGTTAPDWEITGPLTVNLRAERAGGADRLYAIVVVTTDFAGNSTTSTVVVSVSH
jgi:hypothetical protein